MDLPQTNSRSVHTDAAAQPENASRAELPESPAFKALRRGFGRIAGLDLTTTPSTLPLSHSEEDPSTQSSSRFAWTVAACALTTLIAVALRGWLDPVNLVMLYLLAVVLLTIRFGRAAGVVGSFLAVLAFDVFLVPPYHSLSVADTEYLLTFAIMLAVSLIISHLTASLRRQMLIAYARERRARALFDLSRELSGALTREQISEIGTRHVQSLLQTDTFLLFTDDKGKLEPPPGGKEPPGAILDAAQRIFDSLESGKAGPHGLTHANVIYQPLHAPVRARGMLVLSSYTRGLFLAEEQERLLQTIGAQIALAIERVHYVEVAQTSTMAMESERLRNSLLSAVSHDVRTPLTAIVGMTSTLAEGRSLSEAARNDLVTAIHNNALRMNDLVSNLLDMARLHAGKVVLKRQWQMLEEVVGSALAQLRPVLQGFDVTISLPKDLPLLEFDAVLIERVLFNLLDNAVRHAADGQMLRIAAERHGDDVFVAVEDHGPGVPAGLEETVFRKFARGEAESAQPGVGLGLSICHAIVEAHHGRIWVESRPRGGARFVFSLPAGSPPALEDLDDES